MSGSKHYLDMVERVASKIVSSFFNYMFYVQMRENLRRTNNPHYLECCDETDEAETSFWSACWQHCLDTQEVKAFIKAFVRHKMPTIPIIRHWNQFFLNRIERDAYHCLVLEVMWYLDDKLQSKED